MYNHGGIRQYQPQPNQHPQHPQFQPLSNSVRAPQPQQQYNTNQPRHAHSNSLKQQSFPYINHITNNNTNNNNNNNNPNIIFNSAPMNPNTGQPYPYSTHVSPQPTPSRSPQRSPQPTPSPRSNVNNVFQPVSSSVPNMVPMAPHMQQHSQFQQMSFQQQPQASIFVFVQPCFFIPMELLIASGKFARKSPAMRV